MLVSLLTGFGLLVPSTAHADEESLFWFENFKDGPLVAGPWHFQLNPNYRMDKTLKPQGQFLIISMEVANGGNRPARFVADYQTLTDSSGRVFAPDITAGLRETKAAQLADINPGNKFSADLVFDVPPRTVLSSYILTFRASAASSGVSFRLPVGELSAQTTQADVDKYIREHPIVLPGYLLPPSPYQVGGG